MDWPLKLVVIRFANPFDYIFLINIILERIFMNYF